MVSEVTVDTGAKVKLTKQRLNNPAAVMKRIGALLVSRAQQTFDKQKLDDENAWDERMNPNFAGVLADADRGRGFKDRRLEGRPAGKDTGRLQNSLAFQLLSKIEVEYGTNVEYGAQFQFGGPVSIPITAAMVDGVADMVAKRPSLRTTLAFLLNKKEGDSFDFVQRPRPFVGVTDKDREDIKTLVRQSITKPKKPPTPPAK